MKQIAIALIASLLAFSAMAVEDYNGNEIPLPPPTGPGNGPQPAPPPYAPPEQQPQPPEYPPGRGQEPPQYPEQPAPQPPPQYPTEQSYSLGVVHTNRNSALPYNFHPTYGLDQVIKLQVTSVLKKVNVQSVTVFYANGGSQVLSNMGGVLREGQAVVARLSGSPVERIVVQASSSAFWSSKGAFRVDITIVTGQAQEVQLPPAQ